MEQRRRELVEANLPLVEHVVLRVSANFPRHVDRQELLGAGMMGLVEAATRFEFDRSVPFSVFAARRIRGSVLDLVRSTDWAPRSLRQQARDAETATQELACRLGRGPEAAEVEAAMGLLPGDMAKMTERLHRSSIQALDTRLDLDSGDAVDRLADRTAPEPDEVLENEEMKGYLRAALHHLPERHRAVVVGYYLEGRSFEELATLLDVTTSRISQLRSDALEMVRDGIDAQYEPRPTGRPKGRVAIRKAGYAAAIARQSDWHNRLPEMVGATSADTGSSGTGSDGLSQPATAGAGGSRIRRYA